jgi:hypothetical protein
MFLLWFALLGGSFVFLDVGPSILFLCFPLFGGALVNLWLAGFQITCVCIWQTACGGQISLFYDESFMHCCL